MNLTAISGSCLKTED